MVSACDRPSSPQPNIMSRSTTFHQSLLFLVICDLLFLVMTLTDEYVDPDSAIYIIIFPYFW